MKLFSFFFKIEIEILFSKLIVVRDSTDERKSNSRSLNLNFDVKFQIQNLGCFYSEIFIPNYLCTHIDLRYIPVVEINLRIGYGSAQFSLGWLTIVEKCCLRHVEIALLLSYMLLIPALYKIRGRSDHCTSLSLEIELNIFQTQ